MTLERWVEKPPEDYLKRLPIWICLRNIPVNHDTKDTIHEIAEHIETVTDVAFDPLKPQSKGYVRVRVLFDVSRPLKNSRLLQTSTGEMVTINIEYERIRRRCYQCQRLTHDKDHFPFNPLNRQEIATGGVKKAAMIPARLLPQISEDDPLFGVLTNEDVGIDFATGKPKIAKEVLDEMRQYLSVADPKLKKIHIARVRKSVWDLEGDHLQGQKSMLRLEAPAKFTTDVNKGKGLVFNFEGVGTSLEIADDRVTAAVAQRKAMSRLSQPVESRSATYATASQQGLGFTGFKASYSAGSTGTKSAKITKRRRPNQWKRKAQALQADLGGKQRGPNEGEDTSVSSKRKAVHEPIWTAKVAKHNFNEVVPNEEPPKQV
ncbi:uncharacterized protein LOC111832151 [Capsella rubella]|uniref:uncharacterized protein LOC111832151 n=1 Tax=Capsella rubella TaxID=81985 RepID=UPI000CD4A440|nr:uncharacterized protein LOC111832151 [Capsella rubella]